MREARMEMKRLLREARRREKHTVELLGRFVRCESPSHDKAAVDRFGRLVAKEWQRRGAELTVLRQTTTGNHVRAEFAPGKGRTAGQILVLGHLDTVYRVGSLAHMPFRVARGRAFGPGAFDMKGGLVVALAAADLLRATGIRPLRRLVFLWTSDEEIGSASSRRIIEREARRSAAVLVLEPALGREGWLKTARKGVGGAEIVVTGRSAHAGVDPKKGVNAVHELALQIARLMKMSDPSRGTSIQATVIEGGTVSNVVPAEARAKVDIRFARMADARRIERKLRSLRPISKGAKIKMQIGPMRPPLERTAKVCALFEHAQSLARKMDFRVEEGSTGGGSDGNFTAALGIPTLDGLGAVGDGAHSPQEHIIIKALPERAALLAGLLATL